MDTLKLDMLAKWVDASSRVVFFGGAGVSTESGIPDFRSAAGIYQSEHNSPYTPEDILSRRFFDRHPEIFYDFYRSKMLHPEAQPNPAHRLLASLERQGILDMVITQNIDGLHQLAGSTRVQELHGSIHRNHCMDCARFYTLKDVCSSKNVVPVCTVCGGVIKPDVVLYGESLDDEVIQQSVLAIQRADLMIIGGTSLTVQPAASMVSYFSGGHVVLINASSTAYDHKADLLITDPIGVVMETMAQSLKLKI
ncbi:NAD-dependent protein deacylase [Paenibacillus sp. YPG26]|uniref:NAD-dependent protein deacylase n=1 Tax=Paenibacillus sp. YPG26 TaxID=2878915 RepID=UPI00203E47A5|nr:NAD-dependent protein deacylase [Paenibacillus sp. YPG26]USB34324.1 NAD-dependent protein deacylase [Paenibacillus sp. YPG26]